jgi:hypothetical protein
VRRRPAAAAALVALLALAGCGVGMPDSGPVHRTTTTGSSRDDEPASIDPSGPKKGDSPEEIVRGFLYAMQATPPIQTSVAREFLTQEARPNWQPSGMVIYGSYTTRRGSQEVGAELKDADRTDARGAWLGPVSEDASTVRFPMALEGGEWRIAQPPPYFMVPSSWFEQRFRQASLYFFDPSTTILIPEPVFVPKGGQFASALVNALLQGPALGLGAVEQNYLPTDLRSLVSVTVSASGVAKIELTSDTGETAMPTAEQSELLVSQLAWTLQQDGTITRFGVTIDGRPVQLPGETEFDVEHGHEYAPYVAGSSTQLFGLAGGRMVGGSPENLVTVRGPFGQGGYSLRTIAPDLRAEQVAGVSSSGGTLWEAAVKDSGAEPQALITTGENLLRPSWDFSGRLWEVDRRGTGAVVYYSHHPTDGVSTMHSLDVEGISGKDVKQFLVSRDGSRLVAVVRNDAGGDSIVVSRILTTGDGQVADALTAEDITGAGVTADSRIRDIAWRSPTSLAVLRPVSRGLFQVRNASVDGAASQDSFPVPVEDDVVGLAGTPVPKSKIYAFAVTPAEDGVPARAVLHDLAGVRGAEIELDPRVTMLSYVG